jgi:peptidyl-prolyl cis-trans isomerase D
MIRFLQTPGPAVKMALGGILLIICASMVITLIPGGLGSDMWGAAPGKGVVAKVDGGDVTADDVRQTARQLLQQQMQQANPQTMAMLLPYFSQRAAEQLITRQALIAEAAHLGLKATPQEIQDELQHGRYAGTFFPGGNFIGQTEYEDMLSRYNLTPAKFEDSVGKDIMLSKLQALISGSATVSEAAIREQFVKQNSKIKFDYAVLKQDNLRKALHPSDVELQAFYNSHKQQYANSIPEKRKVKYAVVDTSKVAGSIQITHDDLAAYYDQHRDQYRTPEQVKVSHILIKTPLPGPDGKVDEKGVAEAQHRAEDILKQLKAGGNFEELAKKYSEDPGSAKEGAGI